MNKKIGMLCAMTIVGMSGMAHVTYGVETSEVDSNAIVTFEPGQGGNTNNQKPVDPTNPSLELPIDPNNPLKPGDLDGPGTLNPNGGALRIDYVSNFNFGSHEITSKKAIYKAKLVLKNNDGKYAPNFIQVSDNRGTSQGWNLSVTATPFVDSADQTSTLEGATIEIKNAQAANEAFGNDMAGASTNFTILTDGDATTTFVKNSSGKEHNGEGTWAIAFGQASEEKLSEDVTLIVPIKASLKANPSEYRSTLTWNLVSDTAKKAKAVLPSL